MVPGVVRTPCAGPAPGPSGGHLFRRRAGLQGRPKKIRVALPGRPAQRAHRLHTLKRLKPGHRRASPGNGRRSQLVCPTHGEERQEASQDTGHRDGEQETPRDAHARGVRPVVRRGGRIAGGGAVPSLRAVRRARFGIAYGALDRFRAMRRPHNRIGSHRARRVRGAVARLTAKSVHRSLPAHPSLNPRGFSVWLCAPYVYHAKRLLLSKFKRPPRAAPLPLPHDPRAHASRCA